MTSGRPRIKADGRNAPGIGGLMNHAERTDREAEQQAAVAERLAHLCDTPYW